MERVTFTEFLVNYKTLPKAPFGLKRKSDVTGLIFDKLLVVERLEEDFICVKWRCRCLCGGTRDVWSKNLLRGVVGDCGCRALWKDRKRRATAKKKREAARVAARAARLVERQEQRERNAVAKKKRKALLSQTKAAAMKRWADYYRGNKTTPENEPEKYEQKAA